MPPSDRPDWADEQPPEPARRLLATFEEYAACATELVRRARLELLIFDPDGVQLALDQRERIEALFQFLRGAPVRRLSVIVHHARHLEANCPRFLRLVGQFAGQIDVRVTCGEARRAEDCFIVADREHVLRRPVAAHPRGVIYEYDRAAAAPQRERYEQIWRETESGLSPGALGLT